MSLATRITEYSGFKIPDSHFRIGSKLHISDFYYAKRFFQNGFYASKIAFLLAREIIANIECLKKLDAIKRKGGGLTIIGYEMYSELLVSLVEKFLRKKWDINHDLLNHNILENDEELKLCKKNNILAHVIIIVPIASTFSTAIKIENRILNHLNKDNPPIFIQPYYNIIFVSNKIPIDDVGKSAPK